MRKSTVTVTLALLGPTLVAGCSSRSNSTDNTTSSTGGYRGGGGVMGRSRTGTDTTSSPRGGFGSSGRGWFSGS